MEKNIFTCPCHKLCRVEAVGLYLSNCTIEITIFVCIWKMGNFSKKYVKTAYSKFESKIPFAHMWHVQFWLSSAHCIINFQLSTEFSFKFFPGFVTLKSHSITQNSVSRESFYFKKSINLMQKRFADMFI